MTDIQRLTISVRNLSAVHEELESRSYTVTSRDDPYLIWVVRDTKSNEFHFWRDETGNIVYISQEQKGTHYEYLHILHLLTPYIDQGSYVLFAGEYPWSSPDGIALEHEGWCWIEHLTILYTSGEKHTDILAEDE